MNPPSEIGNYYATNDYAGIFRRLFIVLADSALLLFVFLLSLFFFALIGGEKAMERNAVVLAFAIAGIYFLFLRAKFGLGFFLTGTRLIRANGNRPGALALLTREGPLIFGGIFLLFDLFHFFGSDRRQTFRDLLSGTYVVLRSAQPVGQAPVVLTRYTFWGMHFYVRVIMVGQPKER